MTQAVNNALKRSSVYFATFFVLAFILVCDYIKINFPVVEEIQIIREEFKAAKELDPAEFSLAVSQHSKKKDLGLTLYRDEMTQNTVFWFYSHITKNEEVTQAILQNAEKYDIPLALAFSLAYVESNYKITALNKNTNTTTDRGLFQLNNNSFPHLKETDFFDPATNARYGLSHLRYCLDVSGNEISALAMYNAGATRVRKGATPQVTLNYIGKILAYRSGLEDLFEKQLVAKNFTRNTYTTPR